MSPTLGMVIALHREAVCLAGRRHWQRTGGQLLKQTVLPDRTNLMAVRSGMGIENARCAARWLLARGAGALVAAGVSAGLDPAARPGDLVVADCVTMLENNRPFSSWRTDAAIADCAVRDLAAAGLPARCGPLVTTDRPVLSPEAKADIAGRFGAAVLDMESAAVAETAAEAGVPFLVLRGVSDPVAQAVPPGLPACLDSGGRLQLAAFCRQLAHSPGLVLDLPSLAVQFRAACRTLTAGWTVLKNGRLPALLWEKSANGMMSGAGRQKPA